MWIYNNFILYHDAVGCPIENIKDQHFKEFIIKFKDMYQLSIFLLLCGICLTIIIVDGSRQCRGENNQPLDWYVEKKNCNYRYF